MRNRSTRERQLLMGKMQPPQLKYEKGEGIVCAPRNRGFEFPKFAYFKFFIIEKFGSSISIQLLKHFRLEKFELHRIYGISLTRREDRSELTSGVAAVLPRAPQRSYVGNG